MRDLVGINEGRVATPKMNEMRLQGNDLAFICIVI